ncbi:MAG TPA: S8 family serine peptidase, partial [Planctomycetota bacterium]|nr:S8 family serine peptidase [Planctomycetota bacterium]
MTGKNAGIPTWIWSPSRLARRGLRLAALLAGLACTSQALLAQGVAGRAADGPSWDDVRDVVVRQMPDGRSIAAGELLVSVRDWTEVEDVALRIEAAGGAVVGGIPRLRLLHIRLKPGSDETAEAARYRRLAGVKRASTNDIGEVAAEEGRRDEFEPNDPAFPFEWQIQNTGQDGGKPGADIELLPAWKLQTGDPGIVVAVLDTGADFTHPEFQGRLLQGYDFLAEDADPTAETPHAIWVSSMIGANVNNGIGVCGVDWNCKILPVRVVNVAGQLFDLLQGIDYATASGAQVINMSLQKYGYHEELVAALAAARHAGKILVACSGNGISADNSWPGTSRDTLSIGWTQKDDVKANGNKGGSALDFVAPGFEAVVAAAAYATNTHDVESGSSFAAPLVAGVIAL